MEWSTIQTALIEAVQTAVGDSTYDVLWTDRENAWRESAHVKLQVLSLPQLGRGERRYSSNDDGTMDERIYMPRRLVIQFLCEAQDQDLIDSALPIAETISARFQSSDIESILDTACIGVAQIGEIRQVNAPARGHNRVRSLAVFDVTFNAHTSIAGPTIGYVESVVHSGTIEDGPDTGPTTVSASD